MKLEIDIPSILYQDAKENGNYISVTKLEIAWKAIADGKPLEQETTTKNDLGVDCVARQDVERFIEGFINEYTPEKELEIINLELDGLKHLPPVTPQEPFINKPCISSGVCAHDKQKVLDKIRAEIETKYGQCKLTEYIVEYDGICKGTKDIGDIADILQIIDKYKSEREDT